MRRSNIVLIVVILVVLGFLVYLSNASKSSSDMAKWRFNYGYEGEKLPYDRDFFIDFMKETSGDFDELEERFSRIDKEEGKGLYFFYNDNFAIDRTESDALYQFVAEGNNAVIIAHEFNYELFQKIRGVQFNTDESYFSIDRVDSAITLVDELSLHDKITPIEIITYGENALRSSFRIDTNNLANDIYGERTTYMWDEEAYAEDEYAYEEEEYAYEEEAYEYEEESYEYEKLETVELDPVELGETNASIDIDDIQQITVLGKTKKLNANLIRIDMGEGSIYLHSNPVLFTNAQFDKPEVFDYVKSMFSDIDYTHVYWDELSFQFLNAKNEGYGLSDKSYFEYIFKNRALKAAFYFFLIGLIVFLVVGIKRKYNTIEVVDPVTNSSIDFSKTIARLYWLNPNHRKMADQKMKMFLFEVRNRYGLTTHELNDDFKSRFKSKTGVSDKLINRLFDAYNLARQSSTIHRDVLIQISETIVLIRQQWK